MQQDKTQFERGVHYIIGTWTLVELAISHGFAGRQTARKAEMLESDLLSLFYKGKSVGVDQIEDFLFDFLEEKLNTHAEDGSVEVIADDVLDLFDACQSGDFSRVEELHKLYDKKHPLDRPPPAPQRMELDEDEEGEEDSASGSDEEEEHTPSDKTDSPAGRRRQVDEDGWEVVTHKGRGKGK